MNEAIDQLLAQLETEKEEPGGHSQDKSWLAAVIVPIIVAAGEDPLRAGEGLLLLSLPQSCVGRL